MKGNRHAYGVGLGECVVTWVGSWLGGWVGRWMGGERGSGGRGVCVEFSSVLVPKTNEMTSFAWRQQHDRPSEMMARLLRVRGKKQRERTLSEWRKILDSAY